MDILTIVVPPALPAAMTVGTVYAQGNGSRQPWQLAQSTLKVPRHAAHLNSVAAALIQ